uniref:Dynactin 1 n=1 Tax=Kwoniella dejecticola CBS 10117 TaxID=1296121 RepID=A0A1A6A322_9TREE|nr:dynactin 1 [Kwoniella dejecticola CBS 10117]OBR84456.1 dynactin 1 [Kwoniella dejecticola CBS 10117]
MTTPEAPVGAKVSVTAGIGYVRWTGSNPGFAAGKWVGVELLEAGGKNDGSVKGERYFECQPNHGVFVRPSQVKILELPLRTSETPISARHPPTPSSRLSSAGPSRASSPQKAAARSAAAATPATPPRAVSQPTSTPAQPSTARRASSAATPATSASGRASVTGGTYKRPPSVAGRASTSLAAQIESEEVSADPPKSYGNMSPPPIPRQIASPSPAALGKRVVSPTPSTSSVAGISPRPIPTRSISSTLSPAFELASTPEMPTTTTTQQIVPGESPEKDGSGAAFTQKRELEELRIKIRILENRKHEDQEKIKALESRVGEADILRAARVKLQAKFQELQSSLITAQKSSKDLQAENNVLEIKAAEAMDQLEMAALDREVAEEKAESAELEKEKLSERVQELELEVAVLKEENEEYEKPVSGLEGERTSLAFVQLEKHNERLKEALIRLRDVSTEAERDHKAKVAELEKELTSQENLFNQLELAEAKLANAEAQVDDLKLQLDDALGAEDMLEQLTERNLQMGERIEEMRTTIEDLEALKELNDELEENHVDAEKVLNEEIQTLTLQLKDEQARAADVENVMLDMEATITQFRDLVSSLQSEIDELRMQQATVESETASTSKDAQALMNLNLKLQSTAVKAQSKTVDLELKKLEAAQLAEHLRIVTSYLPDAYNETEVDSTTIYLFFGRVSAKVDMLISIISQLHGLPASLHSASSEALVGVCELKGKLRHFSGLNKRFFGILRRCTPDDWLLLGKMLSEVAGVENKVDGWLMAVKNDEFNEGDCARELSSLIAQFDHLSETAFNKPQLDVGEQQLSLSWTFDSDLDNFAAAVGFARQAVMGLTKEDDIEIDVGDSSLDEGVYEPVQRILDLVRSVKVPSGKLVAQLEEIASSSSALLPELTIALGDLVHSVSNAVDLAVQLAQRIGAHAATLRASKQPLRLSDIERFLVEITAESSATSDAHPWELIAMFVTRLGNEMGSVLPKVKEAVKGGHLISMDISPPWLARVATIKEAASFNADTERKVVMLSEELKDMLREVKIRDQNLQEAGVKVETLERRLEASRKQADTIIELENDVAKAKKQEKVYEEAIEQLQGEQDALEAENARLRKSQVQNQGDRQGTATMTPGGTLEPISMGSAGSGLDSGASSEQIENLRSAIRFLRHENALLKSKEFYTDFYSLSPLSTRYTPTVIPALDLTTPKSTGSNRIQSPGSSSSSEEEDEPTTPTDKSILKHNIQVESKLLYNSLIDFKTTSKIVDISNFQNDHRWRRKGTTPEYQLMQWRNKEKKLERRLEGLKERFNGLSPR